MPKKWKVLYEYSEGSDIVELLLKNRNIENTETFLNPPQSLSWARNFTPEFKQSLLKAKEIIKKALEEKIPIVIHGDYDADGICSTAILYNTIKNELDYENCLAFIPNRFDHGYGLTTKSIDEVLTKLDKPNKVLFITVDSGITAVKEVEYIKNLGHLVIITDHHQKPEILPPADCIVWEDCMVGAGISWFVSKTLGSKDPKSLALAALATVTDLQPLVNLNRSLVKDGLAIFNTSPSIGIKKLIQISGRRDGEITTYDLGWVLGPRLNATGRIIDATHSLSLLLEKDEAKAEEMAIKLNQVNSERQNKTLEMYEIANVSTSLGVPKIIVSSSSEYHEGIIGLVAARLVQKYYRPSVVISLSEEYGKGSVRSVAGIDIIKILRQFNDMFISLGGHPMAAGFTIKRERIPELEEKLKNYCEENVCDDLLEPTLEADLQIPLHLINYELAESLDKMQPFGIGNREPIFVSENVGIAGINTVGKENKHISFRFFHDGTYYKGIYFNGSDVCSDLLIGDYVNLAYKIKTSEYNGNKQVSLIVEDLYKHI